MKTTPVQQSRLNIDDIANVLTGLSNETDVTNMLSTVIGSLVTQPGLSHNYNGYYRVAVSAHGIDNVVTGDVSSYDDLNVDATILFQQAEHDYSAFACSSFIPAIGKTYCDFRTMVFQCISKIIFSDPARYLVPAVTDFQEELFRSLYRLETAMYQQEYMRTYNVMPESTSRFGNPLQYAPFQTFGYNHDHFYKQKIRRRYDLSPGIISFKPPLGINQLEYTDNTKNRIFLANGLSLSADLIDMDKNPSIPGIEVNMITDKYRIEVDICIDPKPRFRVNIFDLLDNLNIPAISNKRTRNSKSPNHDNNRYDMDVYEDLREIKKRRQNELQSGEQKYVESLKRSVFKLFEKYGVVPDAIHAIATADQLLDLLFTHVNTNPKITPFEVDPNDQVGRFLDKYNGNLCTLLYPEEIEALCKLKTVSVLTNTNTNTAITHTPAFSVFIKKVFLLDVLCKHLPSRTKVVPSVTSDDIIAILSEHYRQHHKQQHQHHSHPPNDRNRIHIHFFDQTCRNCSASKCGHYSAQPSSGGRYQLRQHYYTSGKPRKTFSKKRNHKISRISRKQVQARKRKREGFTRAQTIKKT